MSGEPVKLLVSGPIRENIDPLLARLEKLNSSPHGPFAACLVVGDVLEGGHAANPELLEKLKSGEIKPAVPLHFIFGSESASPAVSALFPKGGEQLGDSQAWFLGHAGVATVAGLNVAFLGGSSPSKQDAAKLLSAHEERPGVVDVLLSCAWPAGFQKHCPSGALPSLPAGSPILPAAGNVAVATVAAALKPRYHFVGTYGVFYQRPPFPNTPLKPAPEQWHLTRLIALGDVNTTGDKAKKYLHALSIAPGQAMAPLAPGCTPNPFDSSAPAPPGAASSGGGAAAAGGGDRGVKRARTDAGPMNDSQVAQLESQAAQDAKGQAQFFFSDNAQNKRSRGDRWTGPPPKQCWFCMSSEQYEAHLVASIAEAAYIALPKGGINGDHVLIVPVEHHPALVNAPVSVRKDVEAYKASLAKYYAAKGQFMVLFERVPVTRNPAHTHMQVIGLPAANAAAAPPIIRAEAARAGVPVTPLPQGESLQDYVVTALQGNVPRQYLYVELHAPPAASDGAAASAAPQVHRFLHVVPAGASQPLQFGRDLMCALLQLPHRKHWRDCKLSQEQEEQLTNTFREGFQAHDFAAEEDSDSD